MGGLGCRSFSYCTLVLPLFLEGSNLSLLLSEETSQQSVLLGINNPSHHLVTLLLTPFT